MERIAFIILCFFALYSLGVLIVILEMSESGGWIDYLRPGEDVEEHGF